MARPKYANPARVGKWFLSRGVNDHWHAQLIGTSTFHAYAVGREQTQRSKLKQTKQAFVRSVNLAKIDGRTVQPSVILYSGSNFEIGRRAIDACDNPARLIENFKIELGKHDPDNVTRRTTDVRKTSRVTPVGITQDYLGRVIHGVNESLIASGRALPKNVVIAEPIALSGPSAADEEWLNNYRRSVRRALKDKFENLDFIPEPFAVFQYYRYGLRHPLVAEQRKYIALVLDFGGGTFDMSIIETAASGDVSRSGKNSRPLAARSIQVGGSYYNRMIADELIFSKIEPRHRAKMRKFISKISQDSIVSSDEIEHLSDDFRSFFSFYKKLLSEIERAKIAICRSIVNWDLSARLTRAAPYQIKLPKDPFSESSSEYQSFSIDAEFLRHVFVNRLWKTRIKEAISKTIDRARSELKGQEISHVLLSGGSSNIGWLEKSFREEFESSLPHANVIELRENYQEIVAKGLATECARRFYTEGTGDFKAVTYNRLCLVLKPDDADLEVRRFRVSSENIASLESALSEDDEGVLLPSAAPLRGLFDEALTWKVRLSRPPKRHLDYFFLRSSFDPEDLDARYNVEEFRAETPSQTRFHSSIEVSLNVRADGTATPTFRYGKSNQSEGTSVQCRPFFIDMTDACDDAVGQTYLGLDFGTSTTSCSFVDSADVQVIEERDRAPEWRELSEIVNALPYPASEPLGRFVGEPDHGERLKKGRRAVEAMLGLAAYLSFIESSVRSLGKTAHFKGFAHRSAGPLWALLRTCLENSRTNLLFSRPLLILLEEETQAKINNSITSIAKQKHDKEADIDYIWLLSTIGNALVRIFERYDFGVFEHVVSKRFARGNYRGIFRTLMGSSQAFTTIWSYEGPLSFSDDGVYIVDRQAGQALPLSPLYLWGLNREIEHNQDEDLLEFDSVNKQEFGFKTVQRGPEIAIKKGDGFDDLYDIISEWRERDPKIELIEGLVLFEHGAS